MVRPRKVTLQQLEALLDFMEGHSDLARNRLQNSTQGQASARLLWEQLASRLNSLENGDKKSFKGWKNYWNELKYKSKKKACLLRRHTSGTGGGPSSKLTEMEERLIALVGPVAANPNRFIEIPITELHEQTTITEEEEEEEEKEVLYVLEVVEPKPTINNSQNPDVPLHQEKESLPSWEVDLQQPYQGRQNKKTQDSTPAWAVEMERQRMEDDRRRIAAIESIANSLLVMQQTLTRVTDHLLNQKTKT